MYCKRVNFISKKRKDRGTDLTHELLFADAGYRTMAFESHGPD